MSGLLVTESDFPSYFNFKISETRYLLSMKLKLLDLAIMLSLGLYRFSNTHSQAA